MLSTQPIDCVTLRRRDGCLLSINAVDVSEIEFRFDGIEIRAHSAGMSAPLRMPNESVADDIRRMLSADPKSVYVVELDDLGNAACQHGIVVVHKGE